ncbi:MAG: metallophosphoesterase family protein, partial [Planctomycetota bacterium]
GHTHVPGVFTDEPDFYPPEELDRVYKFNDHEKAIVNPGSVGQPRDLDPRASYAILADDRVEFFRLDYDVDSVAQKIFDVPELSDWLGERLREGR